MDGLQRDFDNELTRLTALHIPDDELEIARRYYSQKERKSMPASAFCGPGRSFPVTSQEDVTNAAGLAGHAANPDAVRACIRRKAKANGWKLPDSWTSDDGDGDRTMTADIERAKAAATHPPFTGRHSHGHPHEIDGYGHEHSHEHANDNMHDHTHTHHRAVEAEALHMYVPITRIDKDKWTIEGQATSDAIDSYGTIFDYESSKRAFQTWRGNLREMHQLKAVGRALEVIPNDETHTITVRAFVSKGSRDTWEKVLDGTLSGFSIGVPKGAYKLKEVERGGKSVPMYYDHTLAELSLVDNPGSPGCDIAVVRADGVTTEVLDATEETTPPTPEPEITRAGARISHATQSDLHGLRDGHLQSLKKVADLCACEICMALCAILDPDGDGDIDVVDSLDMDGDGGIPDGASQDMLGPGVRSNISATIERNMAPLLTRVHAMLSSHAARPNIQQPTVEFSTEPMERRIADVERAVKTDIAEVRSLLSEVKVLAEKIAAQPAPGGPIMTPVDKRLATSPQQQYNPQADIDVLTRASQLVPLSQEEQVKFAAEVIRRQNRG